MATSREFLAEHRWPASSAEVRDPDLSPCVYTVRLTLGRAARPKVEVRWSRNMRQLRAARDSMHLRASVSIRSVLIGSPYRQKPNLGGPF